MPLDETNIRQTLMALADGELEPDAAATVLEYLIQQPQWLAVLRDDQRLRAAARRTIVEGTPTVPEAVRKQIAALSPAGEQESVHSAHRQTTWRLPAIAAAVALLLGGGTGWLLHTPAPTAIDRSLVAVAVPRVPAVPAIPASLASAVTRVHVDCSRFPLANHAGAFPVIAPYNELAESVRKAFHTDVSHPDLTSIGFIFVGAGPCAHPLDGTAHLLYRSATRDSGETLSVFVQADLGQLSVPDRKLIAVAGDDAPHPAYVWRADGAVFFLVTDAQDAADHARMALELAMAR